MTDEAIGDDAVIRHEIWMFCIALHYSTARCEVPTSVAFTVRPITVNGQLIDYSQTPTTAPYTSLLST